jgi:hypothetical protein
MRSTPAGNVHLKNLRCRKFSERCIISDILWDDGVHPEGVSMRRNFGVLMAVSAVCWLCIGIGSAPARAQQAAQATQPAQTAQTAQTAKPTEPEMMDAVYLLDPADQNLKPLPKEAAKVVTRGGFGKAHGDIQISEPASSFRLKSGDDLKFVVKCTDPENFSLYAFKPKGKNREAVVSTAKAHMFSGPSVEHSEGISLAVSKYGDSSYLFVVKAPEAGEYGFVTRWTVYHFAVDAKQMAIH